MKTEAQVWTVLVDANPAPDVDTFDLDQVGIAADLATLEKRSSKVTQVETKPDTPKKSIRRSWKLGLAAALAVVMVATLVFLQGDQQPVADDPVNPTEGVSPVEATLIKYAETRNAGDIGPLMRMYLDIATVHRHPYNTTGAGFLFSRQEIRPAEELAIAAQGSGTGLEIFDIQVDQDASQFGPNVTFRWRFHYGADGEGSGGEAGCYGGTNADAQIQAGIIKEIDWGFNDPSACSG